MVGGAAPTIPLSVFDRGESAPALPAPRRGGAQWCGPALLPRRLALYSVWTVRGRPPPAPTAASRGGRPAFVHTHGMAGPLAVGLLQRGRADQGGQGAGGPPVCGGGRRTAPRCRACTRGGACTHISPGFCSSPAPAPLPSRANRIEPAADPPAAAAAVPPGEQWVDRLAHGACFGPSGRGARSELSLASSRGLPAADRPASALSRFR
jgi:hypothetical protein